MRGKFVNHVMNFLTGIKGKLILPPICNNPQTPPPLPSTVDLTGDSAQTTPTVEGQSNNERLHIHYQPLPNNADSNVLWIQWSLIGVCIATVGITVQALQTSVLLNSASFNWICMALVFSLTAVMVSIFISGNYNLLSFLVVCVGIFIVFTALVVALVSNLKLPFLVISVAVYLIGILIIIFANLRMLKR